MKKKPKLPSAPDPSADENAERDEICLSLDKILDRSAHVEARIRAIEHIKTGRFETMPEPTTEPEPRPVSPLPTVFIASPPADSDSAAEDSALADDVSLGQLLTMIQSLQAAVAAIASTQREMRADLAALQRS
jgi:hypothetical protein